MDKKVIVYFVSLVIALFIGFEFVDAKVINQHGLVIDTLDKNLVCEDTTVVQNSLKNSGVRMRKVKMYLYTHSTKGDIIKTGRFYRQTIGSTQKFGYCVDMAKDHGTIYHVDDAAYENWILPASKFGEEDPNHYAIRILVFEEAVKEEYRGLTACFIGDDDGCPADMRYDNYQYNVNKYKHLITPESEEMIYNLAMIMAQISSWALSDGEPQKLMKKAEIGQTDLLKIAMAQAVCGIYGHPENPSSAIIESCYYDPKKSLGEQSEDFRYWYNNLTSKPDGSASEYAFVRTVWDQLSLSDCGIFSHKYGCYKNNTYLNYYYAFSRGEKKPTLYIPEDPNEEQRLLSDYYCEPEGDNPPNGCWELKANIPNSCKQSDNHGYVKDIDDWKCIFSSQNSGNAEIREHYNMDASNPYCTVFCQESINMYLPDYGTITSQGSYLTVNLNNSYDNNIKPLNYIGKKTCTTTSEEPGQIDWSKFEEDYKNANIVVEKRWDDYQTAVANHKACKDQTYSKSSSTDKDGWYSLSSLDRKNHDCKSALEIVEEQKKACDDAYTSDKSDAEKYGKQVDACYTAAAEYAATDTSGYSEEELSAFYDNVDSKNEGCDQMSSSHTKMVENAATKYATCLDKADRYCPPNNDSDKSDGSADFYSERSWPALTKEYDDYTGTVSAFLEEEKKPSITHATHCASYASKEASAKADYDAAVRLRDGYLENIRSCTGSKIDNINYNTFNPKVMITYEEEVYGTEAGWELKSKTVSKKEQKNFYLAESVFYENPEELESGTEEIEVPSKKCSTELKKCEDDVVTYNKAYWWEKTIEIEKSYSLDSSVYRYVEKGTGQSVHNKKTGVEYIDMGFGNLPIHYSAIPTSNVSPNFTGLPDNDEFNSSGLPISKEHYDYVIYTKSFGGSSETPNKFNKYIFDTQTFNGISYYGKYDDYECQYKLNCSPMIADNGACPTVPSTGDGLNLVYRTISMYSKTDAFPGQDGTGRVPGDNWDDDSIQKEIVNNRGVANYEVYSLPPMYEIELKPNVMREIRRYNRTKTSSLSTIYEGTTKKQSGLIGYANYDDFKCTNGLDCESMFIRGRVTGFEGIKVEGCVISGSC